MYHAPYEGLVMRKASIRWNVSSLYVFLLLILSEVLIQMSSS